MWAVQCDGETWYTTTPADYRIPTAARARDAAANVAEAAALASGARLLVQTHNDPFSTLINLSWVEFRLMPDRSVVETRRSYAFLGKY